MLFMCRRVSVSDLFHGWVHFDASQVTLIFSYGVAAAFFHVFDIAVDTMLVCFLVVRVASWWLRVVTCLLNIVSLVLDVHA